MVDRAWWYSTTILRGFDLAWMMRDFLTAIGQVQQDTNGTTTTVVSGFGATASAPTSLVINLAAGRIYQQAERDATAYSVLASDPTLVQQQGFSAAQTLTLSTSGLTSGQSMWALIQATFGQVDEVRPGDPTGGVESYFNSNNPSQPFQGPGNNDEAQPTVRLGTASISVVYGTPATTGSEVPPNPSSGNVPLYLIDLAFGQTTVAQNQILSAGPSVGTGVPSNYPYAPFLAGLLNSHHNGTTGQAPKINLTNAAEVRGVLPSANSSGISVRGQSGANYTYQNSDVGRQVNRSNSGTAMFDVLPGTSPGQINATGVINIFNDDVTALLAIGVGSGATLNGALSYNDFLILGPGQSAYIISDGANYWVAAKPDRVVLGAATTLFVSTTGSDTANSGLTSGSPFASLQKAWDVLQDHFDLSGQVATIQLANGTYTAPLAALTPILGASGPASIVFQGGAAPSDVTISMVSETCFAAGNGASFTIQGMTLAGTGDSNGIVAQNGGQANFSAPGFPVAFGAMGTGTHIFSVDGGAIVAGGAYSISGGAGIHVNAIQNAFINLNAVTVTVSGTPGFTGGFAVASGCGVITAAGVTYTGGTTGVRYGVSLNGVIYTGGGGANYFPGNSAGNTATGGQYA